MILRSKMKSISLTLAGAALASTVTSCGDKVDVKEEKNDNLRETVMEKTNLTLALGDHLTITRIVVSRSTPRAFNQDSAAAESRQKYSVEFWGRFVNTNGRADDAASAERHGVIDGLLVDKDGNLYVDGFEPGTIIDNPALKTSNGEFQKEIDRYTINPAYPLVSKFDWIVPVTDSLTAAAKTANFLNLGNLFEIGNKDGDAHKLVKPLGTNTNAFFTFTGSGSGTNDT